MTAERKHPYRVFISYSHRDSALAAQIETHLRQQDLFPITDHEIRVGEAFSEEIREMIECAHVFMPLVTASANERLWVQQEIGFAAALNVPVCPIAVGDLPSGMAEHIQGIHIVGEGDAEPDEAAVMSAVKQRLTYAMLDDLVRRARRRPRQGRYDCALYWNERQELLVNLANAALRDGCRLARQHAASEAIDRDVWRLRQSTAFGSFSIPDSGVNSPVWDQRDPDRYRSQHERRLLRRERQVMEAYTRCFGCDLIVDPRALVKEPDAASEPPSGDAARNPVSPERETRFKHSASRTAFRLRLVIEFIESHFEDDRLRVIMPAKAGQITTNLIIVGDWFAAEAVVPFYHSGGYERTMFTRHAPSVLNMIERFEQDRRDHLAEAGIDPQAPDATARTKEMALKALRECLDKAEKNGNGA